MPSSVVRLTASQITALWLYQAILTTMKGSLEMVPVPHKKIWCSSVLRNRIGSSDEYYRLFRFYTREGLYAELVTVGYNALGFRNRQLGDGACWGAWNPWLDASSDLELFTTASISLKYIYEMFELQFEALSGSLEQIKAALQAAGIKKVDIGCFLNSVGEEHGLILTINDLSPIDRAEQLTRMLGGCGYELTKQQAATIKSEVYRYLSISPRLLQEA